MINQYYQPSRSKHKRTVNGLNYLRLSFRPWIKFKEPVNSLWICWFVKLHCHIFLSLFCRLCWGSNSWSCCLVVHGSSWWTKAHFLPAGNKKISSQKQNNLLQCQRVQFWGLFCLKPEGVNFYWCCIIVNIIFLCCFFYSLTICSAVKVMLSLQECSAQCSSLHTPWLWRCLCWSL